MTDAAPHSIHARTPLLRRLHDCRQGVQRWLQRGRVADRIRLLALWLAPPAVADRASDDRDSGPFATIWDEPTSDRARQLLERVMLVARSLDVSLYLYWGTLLGHVRQGGILPWDDDIDLALFDPGQIKRLEVGLIEAGLRIHEQRDGKEFWIKVFDPAFPVTTTYGWTYPFLDIFVYAIQDTERATRWPGLKVSGKDIGPGRRVMFEGVPCLEPQWPMKLLDGHYPGWRTREQTAAWDHRHERRQHTQSTRPISIGWNGRRRVRSPAQ